MNYKRPRPHITDISCRDPSSTLRPMATQYNIYLYDTCWKKKNIRESRFLFTVMCECWASEIKLIILPDFNTI